MSQFIGKQEEECKVPVQEEIIEEYCPECIPDPYAPKIDWLTQEDPYFDKRSCQYIATILGKKVHEVFSTQRNMAQQQTSIVNEETVTKVFTYASLREYVEDVKSEGTKALLNHFNKLVNKETVLLGKIPEDGIFVDQNSIIKYKLVIEARDFLDIPDAAPAPEEDPPENNTTFPDVLEIADVDYNFSEKLISTKIFILAYEAKYSYFRQVEGGSILYDLEDKLLFFQPKHIRQSLTDFKTELDKLLRSNGLELYGFQSLLGIRDVVDSIRIEFDNSNPKIPFKINKVFATFSGCPEKELLIGIDVFKERGYQPTALFYLTNFEKAYGELTAQEPRDWLEFFKEYTYPPIKVDYGSLDNESKIDETGIRCLADVDLGKLASGTLESFLFSAWDIFSYEFDLKSCSKDPVQREPTLKQFINPKKQEVFEKIYQEELKKIKRDKLVSFNTANDSDYRNAESTEELQRLDELRREEYQKLLAQSREEAESAALRRLNKIKKDNFSHPFYEHFKASLRKKFKNTQSILSVFNTIKNTDKTESEKTTSFINSIGLCGLTTGFKKSLSCLAKQVSYEDLIKSSIFAFLKGISISSVIESITELFFLLPPEKQIEVQMKIEKEFGKVKPPWEKDDTFDFERKQLLKEEARKTEYAAQKTDTSQLTNTEQSEFLESGKKAVDKSVSVIVEAYTEAIFNESSLDALINKYKNKSPALAFILNNTTEQGCPTPPVKDLGDSKAQKYNFNACNPNVPPINIKFPKINFRPNIFIGFKVSIRKIIREAILSAISAIVNGIVKILEDKLCATLAGFGKAGLNFAQTGKADLSSVFKQAFCPGANQDEANELANSLLNKIGAEDTDIQSALDCFSGAMLGTLTQRELIELMTLEEKNPSTLKMFSEAIKVSCPRMSELFNTPSRAENFFNNMGNLIPQDTRENLLSSLPQDDGVPVYDTICLTSQELKQWDDLRRGNLMNSGLSPEDAAQQVELYNQRAREALSDVLDNLNNGPERELNDVVNDLLEPLSEKCQLKEGQSMTGNKFFREPQELVRIQDDISDKIFDNILDSLQKELSSSPLPFSDGTLVEKILSDSSGNHYGRHNFFSKKLIFTKLNYHDIDGETIQKKFQAANFIEKFFDSPDNGGYFPGTIGQFCLESISEGGDYFGVTDIIQGETRERLDTKNTINHDVVVSKDIEKESYSLNFSREVVTSPVTKYNWRGKIGFITQDSIEDDSSLSYKIKFDIPQRNLVFSHKTTVPDPKSFEMIYTPSTNYRNSAFDQFISNKTQRLTIKPTLSSKANHDTFMNFLYNSVSKGIVESSDGFLFGYEEEDLTEDDLRYVNPEEGSEEYTYSDEEKVLGRSYTNNDRVVFLNPENYGGSYTVPPVYIKPKEMSGWLKYSKIYFPSEEECEEKTQNLVNPSEIKQEVNNARNSMKLETRSAKSNSKCFFHAPFDRVLNKNALSCIEGIIKVHIRMKLAEEIIKGTPALGHLKFNDENYDNSFAKIVQEKLSSDLKSINPFGPRQIEKQNYYLLFLEQTVQKFIRENIEDLPNKTDPETTEPTQEKDLSSLPEEVQKAYTKILAFKDNFSYENIMHRDKTSLILLKDAEINESIVNTDLFYAYAEIYQKLGEKMFNSSNSYNYNPAFLGFFDQDRKRNLFSVIFTVRLLEEECLVILRHAIRDEMKKMLANLYSLSNPKIESLNKFILTNKDLFHENSINNFGEYDYEQRIAVGSFADMGSANDVVDINENQVFEIPTQPKMKIERYIRIVEKETDELPPEVVEVLELRDHNLRGVVSLPNLQEFFDNNIDTLGEYYISDLFGTAQLDEEQNKIGNLGLNNGVRILLNLKDKSMTGALTSSDIQLSLEEKCFYTNLSNFTNEQVTFAIPICSAEVEIKEQKIKDLKLENQYDLDCVARKMIESDDYMDFFTKICPIKAISSMTLNYINMFFLNSIGKNDGWENGNKMYRDSSDDFSKTNLKCRKYFASFYNSNEIVNSENFKQPKIEFPDFFNLLFGNLEIGEVNLNIIVPPDASFDHKVVKINPFNKNNEECE